MKQPDHLARALLLFMFPKRLALFTKLSSAVCLESLINPVRGFAEKNVPLLKIAQSSLFIFAYLGVYVKVRIPANVCPALLALRLLCLHLPTASSARGSLWSKDSHFS